MTDFSIFLTCTIIFFILTCTLTEPSSVMTPSIYTTLNDVRRIQPDDTSDNNFAAELVEKMNNDKTN